MFDLSLEQEVDRWLKRQKVRYYNNCNSSNRLDFTIWLGRGERFYLEVKEKRQPIKTVQWAQVDVPEKHLFILDDLSARKILKLSPNSGLLVRSNPTGTYHFFDVVTLWLIPRRRVNRPLNPEETILKGKWMIDLRNGVAGTNLDRMFQAMQDYLERQEEIFETETACYGDYSGEYILTSGEVRTAEFHQKDYWATR